MTGLLHEPVVAPVSAPSRVVQDLLAVRQIIAEGWCQKHYVSDGGNNHCLLGAMNVAWHGVDDLSGRVDVRSHYGASRAVREAIGGEWFATWNDRPGRTQAEVLEMLDRAIENNIR